MVNRLQVFNGYWLFQETMGNIRGNWDEKDMTLAMDKVISKEITLRAASTRCAVPKSTFGDRVKNLLGRKEATAKPCCSDNKGSFSRTFDRDQEEILYNHVKALDTYKLAEKLKTKHCFNKETRMAGKDFYYVFINPQLDLRLRIAESTSLQRAVGLSKDMVNIFFDKRNRCILCTQQQTKGNVCKREKQVGKLTSGERERNVTVLLSINAAGDQFIPLMFVSPRVRIDNDLKKDAPPGSTFDAQMSGWITKDGFLKWMKAFDERVNPTQKSPVLLIRDGHSSHMDLDVILYAKHNHIHMISLPPHTSRSIIKAFKNTYNEACGFVCGSLQEVP
ncbi:hypothetical protein J437_LFUL019334 [Ladona fulva]|uniref:DDE-1 domain-containing protein n=1 Tax=Ladona fulva TaxID=123851 RepID=A0A8K0KRW1_LADFU|nr:hypothetical protein J437_LFUL019334 [Ladona fulva]